MELVTAKPIFGLASDLHLDFGDMNPEFFEWRGDYLLLAGDIGEEDRLRKKSQLEFWEKVSQMATKVFMICGNHEHYNSEIDVSEVHLRKHLEQFPNIHVMKNEAVELGDLILFGSTMWTSFNNNPIAMLDAKMSMNDYKRIRSRKRGFKKIDTNDVLLEHAEATNALQDALDKYPDRPFLVMTHHAPTLESVSPVHRDSHLNDAYCNRFENLIMNTRQIQAWVHGHVHWFLNYDVDGCRVMCNPRGYPGERPSHLPAYKPLSFQLEY